MRSVYWKFLESHVEEYKGGLSLNDQYVVLAEWHQHKTFISRTVVSPESLYYIDLVKIF